MTPFSGYRFYKSADGELAVLLFIEGMIRALAPCANDRDRPLGFYDLSMKPCADPLNV